VCPCAHCVSREAPCLNSPIHQTTKRRRVKPPIALKQLFTNNGEPIQHSPPTSPSLLSCETKMQSIRSVDGALSFVLASLEQEMNQLKESMIQLKQDQELIRHQIASPQPNDQGQNEEDHTRLGDLIDPSLFPKPPPMKGLYQQASTTSFPSRRRKDLSAVGISLEHLRLSESAFLPFVLDDVTKVSAPSESFFLLYPSYLAHHSLAFCHHETARQG